MQKLITFGQKTSEYLMCKYFQQTLRLCSNQLRQNDIDYDELLSKNGKKTKGKKRKKQTDDDVRLPTDMQSHFESESLSHLLDLAPKTLLCKKHKATDYIYVYHPTVAATIADHLKPFINPAIPLIEVNPGLGMLTKELLNKTNVTDYRLYEVHDEFLPKLKEEFETSDRIKINSGDFIGLWKMAFLDRIDGKNRLGRFLFDFPTRDWDMGINAQIIAATGTINFFKHLISAMVQQTSLFSFGRTELFLIVPPPLYIHLTCDQEAGYMFYRSTSILFQIMFEWKLIARLPKKNFIPWQFEPKLDSIYKMAKLNSVDPFSMYLVRIRPRENIYHKCYPEDMQALWFFVKQNCTSRKNRVIPMLEKWIPGIGPKLILSNKEPDLPQPIDPNENLHELPKMTAQCKTMSNEDYHRNLNIFTQFGDLSPSQMLTIFNQFKTSAAYKQSPFLALMENSLMKMETSIEDQIDGVEFDESSDNTNVYDKQDHFMETIKNKVE